MYNWRSFLKRLGHYPLFRRAAVILALLAFHDLAVRAATPGLSDPAAEALRQGRLAADSKQWDVALGYFNTAQAAAPDSPEPYYSLGQAEAQIPGRELRAIGWLRVYLALAPDAPDAPAARKQIEQLDVTAEDRVNDFVALLHHVAVQFPADGAGVGYATAEFTDLTVAITHAKTVHPENPAAKNSLSSAQREKAWLDYVQSDLKTPLFVDFQTTFSQDQILSTSNITTTAAAMWPVGDARKIVMDGGRNNQGLTTFTHIRAQVYEWIDRLAEVRAELPEQWVASRLLAQQDQKQAEERFATLASVRAQLVADLGIKLVAIPAGSFLMGSPPDEPGHQVSEGPQTRVTLTKDFLLGATDVTQGQYEAVTGVNPSFFTAAGKDAPVERIYQEDARAYCDKLTERARKAGYLPEGYAFALPTEAQWEYAARAMTTGPRSGDLDAMAWYSKNSEKTTHPVGQKQPNAWGLYDIYGNVNQWCGDGPLPYPGGDATDPVGPVPHNTHIDHIARGGCWEDGPAICRSAFRKHYPGFKGRFIGFRVALVKLPVLPALPPAPAVASTQQT